MPVELWIDCPKKKVLNEGYFRTLDDLGVHAVSIMIDPSTKAWDPTWKVKDVEKAVKLANALAMAVTLTTWPFPDKDMLAAMKEDMKKYIPSASEIAAWEIDVEFNWKANNVRGFKSLDDAADYLLKIMTEVCPPNVRKEMTTFAQHVENGATAGIAPRMDRLKVQAYSVRNRNGVQIQWDHSYAPGNMQKLAFDRTMMIPGVRCGEVEIVYGMALWDQKWPGHSPKEAMTKALEAAEKYPICGVCGWSSKHVVGDKANPYAAKWLQSLCA